MDGRRSVVGLDALESIETEKLGKMAPATEGGRYTTVMRLRRIRIKHHE